MDPNVSSNAIIPITTTTAPILTSALALKLIPTIRNVNAAPSELNIASVTSISSESFANPTETVTTANTGLMLSDVLSHKDLEKDYMHNDWDKYFATIPLPRPKRKSSVTQAVVELPDIHKPSTASRTDLLQDEIDNAAYVLVKGTGLEGKDLYRCCFKDCEERSSDIVVFNVHMIKHNQPVSVGFKCYHCSLVAKTIASLKYHIKVHGIHRYFCYFCNYTSAIVNDIQKRKTFLDFLCILF